LENRGNKAGYQEYNMEGTGGEMKDPEAVLEAEIEFLNTTLDRYRGALKRIAGIRMSMVVDCADGFARCVKIANEALED
jgi:hypothetical protein